ncbi:hypothetical protein ACFXKR_31075 [Streptomyces violascens]
MITSDEIIGCVSICPSPTDDHDTVVSSWGRTDRAALDAPCTPS